MPRTGFPNKIQKVIQGLAAKQVRASERQFIGTLVTDPVLKEIPGPDSPRPLREGEDPKDFPGHVLAWFADVRLDADKALIQDVLVPTQARGNIGERGSPVVIFKDPTSGAWQVVGRADRITEFQNVQSFTLLDLGLGFIKGYIRLTEEDWVSPFYQYQPKPEHVVTRTGPQGQKQYGLNKGRKFDGEGNPIQAFVLGQDVRPIPLGELNWGVDPLGAKRFINYQDNNEVVVANRD